MLAREKQQLIPARDVLGVRGRNTWQCWLSIRYWMLMVHA